MLRANCLWEQYTRLLSAALLLLRLLLLLPLLLCCHGVTSRCTAHQ